eukprot:TRINITY_DN7110_c0_g1_i5.p1 TRINITY_DN7110_c0_g1~~TRINITY_DN7110_c0_g1_i5.p1  ORF type:complete len:944 (-),score=192.91 TRINITY_DN7110_c0_g1_i5:877-3708(-)
MSTNLGPGQGGISHAGGAESPFIDVRMLGPDEQVELVESYKMEVTELRRLLLEKDEMISKLRVKLFTMKSQMQVQRQLLEAELKRVEVQGSELTTALVKEVELDDMTQNWLANEFTNPGNAILDDDSDGSNEMDDGTEDEEPKAIQQLAPITEASSSNNSPRPIPPDESNEDVSQSISIPTVPIHQLLPKTSSEQELDNSRSTSRISTYEKADKMSTARKKRGSRAGIVSGRVRRHNLSVSFSSEVVPQIPGDILEALRSCSFEIFSKSYDELKKCVLYMFQDLRLIENFMIRPSVLYNFLSGLADEYRANPYHNFRHAIDVTQTVYFYLITTSARDVLQPLDMLALMLSALGHDVGHPGQNNAFQINTQSEIARIYNDTSVLENYHAAKTFEILRSHEYPRDEISRDPTYFLQYLNRKRNGDYDTIPTSTNVLQSLTGAQFKEVRKNMISMILQTDMAKHFDMTAKLGALAKKVDTEDESLSSERREDREFLSSVLLHCADISNVTKPFVVSKAWADCVRDEFYQQGDFEKMYGLPVSPYMDREDSNQARTTLNFIDFVATPLFSSLSIILNGLEEVNGNLISNRQQWQDILEEQLSEPTQPAVQIQTESSSQSNTAQPPSLGAQPSTTNNSTAGPQFAVTSASPEPAESKVPAKALMDTREHDKQIYRRRSVLVLQQVNDADEASKRRQGRGITPKPPDPISAAFSPLLSLALEKYQSVVEEERSPRDSHRELTHQQNKLNPIQAKVGIQMEVPTAQHTLPITVSDPIHQKIPVAVTQTREHERLLDVEPPVPQNLGLGANGHFMAKKVPDPLQYGPVRPGANLASNYVIKGSKRPTPQAPSGPAPINQTTAQTYSGMPRRLEKMGTPVAAPSIGFDGTVVNSAGSANAQTNAQTNGKWKGSKLRDPESSSVEGGPVSANSAGSSNGSHSGTSHGRRTADR